MPTPAPRTSAALAAGAWLRPGRAYTLRDRSLTLPPLEAMAPNVALAARELGDDRPPAPMPATPDGSALTWKLAYRRAQLRDLSSGDLHSDPSTGFARQIDTDVLALGMSWTLAGNRLGLAYQLQSARGGLGDENGLARFLPGSTAATHALTLGVTHELGASLPPPAPPLLVLDAPLPDVSATQAAPPAPR